MKKEYFTTVTTFSKILAAMIFVAMPFGGFYLGQKYQQVITIKESCPICKAVLPTPTSTPTIEGSYTNIEGGYSLVIPKFWKATVDSSGLLNINSSDYIEDPIGYLARGAGIYIKTKNFNGTLADEVKELSSTGEESVPLSNTRYITIDGVKAFQYEASVQLRENTTVIVRNGKQYIVFMHTSPGQKNITLYKEEYADLLKTFKFIK